MRGSEHTLNAWDSQFWLHLPLPLAEVGAQLQAARADYLTSLLRLAEDALALAGAMGLARAVAHGVLISHADVAPCLENPSIGKRIELLRRLEEHAPGCTGWSLAAEASDLRDFVEGAGSGSVPRTIRVSDVLQTLASLRNDVVHGRFHGRVEPVLEQAVLGLISRNVGFREPLLHITDVRVNERGDRELKAQSLSGPATSSYRRGHWQPTFPHATPGGIGIGDPRAMVSAHPFLVVEEGRVFVLDEIKRGVPVLRHFGTRAELRGAALPLAEEAPAPVRAVDPPPPSARLPWVPVSLAGGCLFLTTLGCVVGLLAWPRGGSSADPLNAPASLTAPCPPHLGPGCVTANGLPHQLTGLTVLWGESVAEAERAHGALPPYPLSDCPARFADMREVRTPAPWRVPRERDTTVAFHHDRGLFEVMVFSDAPSAEVLEFVRAQLGPPHAVEDSHRTWDYPLQNGDLVRLKVSALRANHPLGRSAIKVHVLGVSRTYRDERQRAGCQ